MGQAATQFTQRLYMCTPQVLLGRIYWATHLWFFVGWVHFYGWVLFRMARVSTWSQKYKRETTDLFRTQWASDENCDVQSKDSWIIQWMELQLSASDWLQCSVGWHLDTPVIWWMSNFFRSDVDSFNCARGRDLVRPVDRPNPPRTVCVLLTHFSSSGRLHRTPMSVCLNVCVMTDTSVFLSYC